MTESNMFPFINKTWNSIGGVCPYNCVYCWAKGIIKRFGHVKYSGESRIIEKELNKCFNHEDFVFVQDMTDLFAPNVSDEVIWKVFNNILVHQYQPKFLFLTKNPFRYSSFLSAFRDNIILGATIESDLNYPSYSKAPPQEERLKVMWALSRICGYKTFISVEPIMNFSTQFFEILLDIKPWGVAIGYDNYNNGLSEPEIMKTQELIEGLEANGIQMFKKTIRKAWWET